MKWPQLSYLPVAVQRPRSQALMSRTMKCTNDVWNLYTPSRSALSVSFLRPMKTNLSVLAQSLLVGSLPPIGTLCRAQALTRMQMYMGRVVQRPTYTYPPDHIPPTYRLYQPLTRHSHLLQIAPLLNQRSMKWQFIIPRIGRKHLRSAGRLKAQRANIQVRLQVGGMILMILCTSSMLARRQCWTYGRIRMFRSGWKRRRLG